MTTRRLTTGVAAEVAAEVAARAAVQAAVKVAVKVAVLVCASSLLLAACGGGGGDDDDGTGEVRAVSDPATPVEATVGDVIEISLEANPIAGFSWELAGPPETAIIRFLGGDYESRGETPAVDDEEDADGEAAAPSVGSGGTQRLRFQVVGAGATTVDLRYVQPWIDPPSPAATSSFTIRVSGATASDDGEE